MATIRFLSTMCAAALVGTLALSSPAPAQADSHMAEGRMMHGQDQQSLMQKVEKWNRGLYVRYQQAVEAHEFCRGRLSEDAMRAVIDRIEREAGEPLSPGMKLKILKDAKWDMKQSLIADGCHTDMAKEALRTFDMKLAKSMHGGMMMK